MIFSFSCCPCSQCWCRRSSHRHPQACADCPVHRRVSSPLCPQCPPRDCGRGARWRPRAASAGLGRPPLSLGPVRRAGLARRLYVGTGTRRRCACSRVDDGSHAAALCTRQCGLNRDCCTRRDRARICPRRCRVQRGESARGARVARRDARRERQCRDRGRARAPPERWHCPLCRVRQRGTEWTGCLSAGA